MILRALTLYYGGAAVILKDGHLNLQQKGANATGEATLLVLYQSSNAPKIQVKSQLTNRTNTLQQNLWKTRNWQKCTNQLKKNQFHRQNQNIKLYPVLLRNH